MCKRWQPKLETMRLNKCGAMPKPGNSTNVPGPIGTTGLAWPASGRCRRCRCADLYDLMSTKLKVVLQRAEAKDYRDIAAMLRVGVSLPKGLAAARQFFGSNFQPSESLKALVYFEDGDLHTLT